ncbi:MAG: hypothetical protein QM682_09360 [Paracoccus sp. (in: a-proteobacteria)]|uniref:hypothetical protein n=1 Tax=Paracoccus sp. TaxID=267 RepID=UPI0039E55125
MRLLRVVIVLAILLAAGLAGYAYFGDMTADPRETRLPVKLDLGTAPPAAPAPQAPAPTAQDAPAATGNGQNDLD